MIYIGIDAGSVSGALGAIDHNGTYVESFMIDHKDKHILALVFKSRILSIVDRKRRRSRYAWNRFTLCQNKGNRQHGILRGLLGSLVQFAN
jgi:hypothetical protein